MKLVINKCYGGFGLSPKAIARLAELRGQKAYFFTGGIGRTPQVQVDMKDAKGLFWIAYNTTTPTESIEASKWSRMSSEERSEHNLIYESEHIDNCRADRTNPHLIQVVEELGDDASGDCAELHVVEMPDGVAYEIEDYDGRESIHEIHRSWC